MCKTHIMELKQILQLFLVLALLVALFMYMYTSSLGMSKLIASCDNNVFKYLLHSFANMFTLGLYGFVTQMRPSINKKCIQLD